MLINNLLHLNISNWGYNWKYSPVNEIKDARIFEFAKSLTSDTINKPFKQENKLSIVIMCVLKANFSLF